MYKHLLARLSLLTLSFIMGGALAGAPMPSGPAQLSTASISFSDDSSLVVSPEARDALAPMVRSLRLSPEGRLLVVFRPTPQGVQSATALYAYLQYLGIHKDQVKLSTRSSFSGKTVTDSMQLYHVPKGFPFPTL
jgi:hypothetical protein